MSNLMDEKIFYRTLLINNCYVNVEAFEPTAKDGDYAIINDKGVLKLAMFTPYFQKAVDLKGAYVSMTFKNEEESINKVLRRLEKLIKRAKESRKSLTKSKNVEKICEEAVFHWLENNIENMANLINEIEGLKCKTDTIEK